MSQSLWQIGRPDSKCIFFNIFPPWAAEVSNLSRSQPLFSMKYATWFLDEQDTRQSTELKKLVVQSVLLCLSHLYLTSKFIKHWEKKLSKQNQKIKAWILPNQTRITKQMRKAALKHRIFLFSLRCHTTKYW